MRSPAPLLDQDRQADSSFGYGGRCLVVGVLLLLIWAQAQLGERKPVSFDGF